MAVMVRCFDHDWLGDGCPGCEVAEVRDDGYRAEVAALRRRLAAAERVAEAADVFVDSSPYGQHYNRERQALIGSLAAWRKERG